MSFLLYCSTNYLSDRTLIALDISDETCELNVYVLVNGVLNKHVFKLRLHVIMPISRVLKMCIVQLNVKFHLTSIDEKKM